MGTKIDVKSFFKKGVKSIKDDFLIALITGYQGSGKTYFAIYNVERIFKNRIIKTNIKSYRSGVNRVEYFDNIDSIYNDTEDNVIYIIDEVSKRYTKDSKQDLMFYSWLQQSRKHSRYVYIITQEYIQVPTWLRGVANLVYTTRKIRFTNLYETTLGRPVLDKDSMEWTTTETISSIIYKRTKDICSKYDTFECINSL